MEIQIHLYHQILDFVPKFRCCDFAEVKLLHIIVFCCALYILSVLTLVSSIGL